MTQSSICGTIKRRSKNEIRLKLNSNEQRLPKKNGALRD